MRRAPFVVAGTAAGLAAVLGFHTSSVSGLQATVAAGGPAPGGGSRAASPAAPPGGAAHGSAGPSGTGPSGAGPSATGPSATGPSTTTTAGTRRATGQDVAYRYGDLRLQVTVSGGRITKVTPVTDQATDPRSAEINSIAIPMLRDQVLQAQSANIDGVSGATYTSVAYVQSLQAALDQLGWKK